MLDERKSALWQALGLGPEWILREELQELQHKQAQVNVPAPAPTAPAALLQPSAASARPQSPAIPSHRVPAQPKKTPARRKEGRGVAPDAFSPVRTEKIKNFSWTEIISGVKNCHICDISSHRICAVPGEGTPPKDLVLIGEAPGAEEDRQGIPFCGPSGKLLTTILHAKIGRAHV